MKKASSAVPTMMIDGGSDFIQATNDALVILKDLPSFHQIQSHIAIIKEWSRSGMYTNTSKPTFEVGRATWQEGPVWYAGAIVHEGCHSKLCYERRQPILWFSYTRRRYWTGKEAEKICLRLQLQALREMHCDTTYYEFLILTHLRNPTYQDVPYHRRDW
jgi:hypothetical protein